MAKWRSRAEIVAPQPVSTICDAPSPDYLLHCDAEIGHFGWHRSQDSAWYGNAWAVDRRLEIDYTLKPIRRGIFGVAIRNG